MNTNSYLDFQDVVNIKISFIKAVLDIMSAVDDNLAHVPSIKAIASHLVLQLEELQRIINDFGKGLVKVS